MVTENLQTVFLNQIRQSLPKRISLVNELADALDLSRDSAYRRIRGETVLSLEEVAKLSLRHNISLDQLMSRSSDVISFTRQTDIVKTPLVDWLEGLGANLDMMQAFPQKEIIFSAKDIPTPYFFKFPGLAAFKMFFWMKSYQRDARLKDVRFEPELIPASYLDAGTKLWQKYAELPSTEIYSEETFNVTIRQIEFYHANGFITLAEASSLFETYRAFINDLRLSAAAGKKRDGNGDLVVYSNDFLITDTTFLFNLGNKRIAFITYNTMNVLSCVQESFCRETEEFLRNIINKSTLISNTGERERNRFFNAVDAKIRQRMSALQDAQPL